MAPEPFTLLVGLTTLVAPCPANQSTNSRVVFDAVLSAINAADTAPRHQERIACGTSLAIIVVDGSFSTS